MKARRITIVSEIRCELGENPLWDAYRRCLYWTDIPAGRIYCLEHATGVCRKMYEGAPVGGFTLQQNGDLLLFRVNDIAELHADGSVHSLRTFSDEGMER